MPFRRARLSFVRRWRTLPGNVRGGLWMLGGTMFFSLMIVGIKLAGTTMHVTEILFFRQVTILLLAAPAIIANYPAALTTSLPGLQALRIVTAFLAMLLGFTSFIHLPLAEATTLNFAKTFFIGILAILFLGEVVGVRRWGAIITGFIGVLVIAWPNEGTTFNIYSLMAIGSAFCVAIVMTIMRQIAQVDRPVTILSYQAIGVGALMTPPAIWYWTTPTLTDIALVIGIGVMSSIGQLCNIQAFKAGEASAIAPLDYARLLYALLFGWIIFAEWPEPRVFIGALIIVAAAIYTLHRERIRGKKADAMLKTRVVAGPEPPRVP